MQRTHLVYLEIGSRRVFAGALKWPGWCRSARGEDAALESLIAYGKRYKATLGRAARGFTPPTGSSDLEIVERLEGNATTDFGAPAMAPEIDERPLDDVEAKRLVAVLNACWEAFDRTAQAASGASLRTGPRGGGRQVDAMIRHVADADGAYLSRLGGTFEKTQGMDVQTKLRGLRQAFIEAFWSRVRGETLPRGRRTSVPWTPRYAIRRSAWHALDHAWEIEDRLEPEPSGDN